MSFISDRINRVKDQFIKTNPSKKGDLLVFVALCMILSCMFMKSADAHEPYQLVVVVANRITLSDLENPNMPNIAKMLRNGRIGLVSPNSAGIRNENAVMLTASAGTSCVGDVYLDDFYDADEYLKNFNSSVSEEYFRRTGIKAPNGSAVLLTLPETFKQNQKDGRFCNPGNLGDAIAASGLTSAVVGNADSILLDPYGKVIKKRSAAVLAMDSRGIVQNGYLNVDTSNEKQTLNFLNNTLKDVDFIVVNFGLTSQLDDSKLLYSDDAYKARKAEALKKLDSLLGGIDLGMRREIVLVSFSPPLEKSWNRLTPIVVYQNNHGWLMKSISTKTLGLITASDFASTIIYEMSLRPPKGLVYSPVKYVNYDYSTRIKILNDLETRVVTNDILLIPVLWFFGVIGAISFTLGIISMCFNFSLPKWLIWAARAGILVVASCPLSMLLAVLAPVGTAGYITGVLISTIVLTILGIILHIKLIQNKPKTENSPNFAVRSIPILAIYAITVLTLIIDSIFGGYLCKFSILSSYQIQGFRYYGIGNEYAGVVIAMSAVCFLYLMQYVIKYRLKMKIGIIFSLIIICLFGIGSLGANYGAVIASTTTFCLINYAFSKEKFGARHAIIFMLLGLFAAGLFAFLDYAISGDMGSHAAKSTSLARGMGSIYLINIIIRKVLMNMRLILDPNVAKVILIFLPFIALWMYKMNSKVGAMLENTPKFKSGFKAIISGCIAAFLFNDSGIVIASIMLLFTILVFVYNFVRESGEKIA